MSAMKAGMSRNTARKILRRAEVREPGGKPHDWRTRPDPLESVWPQALGMLRQAPELEAKALLEFLGRQQPGLAVEGLLRTFQRRVRRWRLMEGGDKEVFFTQDHPPGETLAVDWTDMGSLEITVRGRLFHHLLFHAVLPYSDWQWALRARTESTLSFRSGLRASLGRLGKVPRRLLVDQSSTATHQLCRDGQRRGFNAEFLAVCEHYGIEPRTINVGRPHENGDCESSHGHLKRRIQQHLYLRGHGDFESEEDYDRFLIGVLESANRLRTVRLEEELRVMREHPGHDVSDYRETTVTVGSNSTIRVGKATYSVPSRLIGARLRARIHETEIALFDGPQELVRLPRPVGAFGPVIDFRHVIGHLVRKPGAFAHYRWREALFPSLAYRAAYDRLVRQGDESQADRLYLQVLQLAVDHGADAVGNALEQILADPSGRVDAEEVRLMLRTWDDMREQWRNRPPMEVRLEDYDALLRVAEEADAF